MKPTSINCSLVRSSKRFLQTVQQPSAAQVSPMVFDVHSAKASGLNHSSVATQNYKKDGAASPKWQTYSLPQFGSESSNSSSSNANKKTAKSFSIPFGQPMKPMKPITSSTPLTFPSSKPMPTSSPLQKTPKPAPAQSTTTSATTPSSTPKAAAPRRKLRPRKAAITLTPTAVSHLAALLNQPNPQMIRIGVKNRGCSGLTYHLEYVDKPGKFDEEIVQDGVKVLIDSKALFSIIGSEMDWVDDKLSSRFVFHNPNSKGQCGCGESFMV